MSEKAIIGADTPTFEVDLKWSLWSKDPEVWQDYAPETWRHIRDGVVGGYLEETGDTLVIRTAPKKEIRYGEVMIWYNPRTDNIEAGVRFEQEYDEDPSDIVEDLVSAPSDGSLKSLRILMAKIDALEDALIEMA